MSLLRLTWQNIIGSSYPIWLISLCALVVTCLALCLGTLSMGAQVSLQLAVARVGADVVVVPEGAGADFQKVMLLGGAFKGACPGPGSHRSLACRAWRTCPHRYTQRRSTALHVARSMR